MVQIVHRRLFCLNLGFAISLMSVSFILRGHGAYTQGRLNPPGHLSDAVYKTLLLFRPLANSAVLLSATVMVAVFIWAALKFMPERASDRVLRTFGGVAALVAIPLCWLGHWPGGSWDYSVTRELLWLALLEISVIGGLLYLTRATSIMIWGLILVAHYGLWAWYVLGLANPQCGMIILGWTPIYLSLIAPCASFAWAFYSRHPVVNE